MSQFLVDQLKPGDLQWERAMGADSSWASTQASQYAIAGVNNSGQLPGGVRGVAFSKTVAGQTGTAGSAAGVSSGVQTLGATFTTTIPYGVTMATGLTFLVNCIDDGTNPADLGLVGIFGIQTKVLTNGSYANFGVSAASTSTFIQAGSGSTINTVGPEQTGTVTLYTTAGGLSTATINTSIAQLGYNAAAGSLLICRIRRIGQSSSDTCIGRIIVIGVHIYGA